MSVVADGELHRRVADVAERARAAVEVRDDADGDLATVQMLLQAVNDRLAGAGRGAAAAERHARELAQLEARFAVRRDALARAHAAATGLRRLTSPDAILTRAPAALCEGSSFRRALVSTIRDSTMVPAALHVDGEPDGAQALLAELRAEPLRLEHPLIETEVLRRRRATLVTGADVNPRVSPRLLSLMGWSSYVAAPLLTGAAVVGIVHADRSPNEPLDVLDRDVLWEFATALSQAHESASLRRTLRRERDELRRFLEWLNARSVALADGPITLAPRTPQEPPVAALPGSGRDDRLVFAGLLTRRELDVMRLLADGGSNRTIADSLVLSETTVKFHVNSILRKLQVANRAEAVARYLALLAKATPSGE